MLNKVIWTYWYQGYDNAPPVVKPCIEQWKHLNPNWELRFIDKDNIKDYTDDLGIKASALNKIPLAVSSDLFKLQLLIKYGGVWADATTYPLIPLDDWLLDKMQAGYFYFYKPGRDRLISTWFKAAQKGNIMLKMHYEALINYWNNNNFKSIGSKKKTLFESYLYRLTNRNLPLTKLWFTPLYRIVFNIAPYSVTHYMFYNLISKNKHLRDRFESMPKISAHLSHVLSKKEVLDAPLDKHIKDIIDNKKTPVIKLNSRHIDNEVVKGSNLDYLYETYYY